MKKRSTKKLKGKKGIIIASIVAVSIAAVALISVLSYISFFNKKYSNTIFPGVSVNNVDISGKTKEEAKSLLEDSFKLDSSRVKIVIKTPEKEYPLVLSKINAKYDISEVVNEAYNYGKDLNMFKKHEIIKNPIAKNYPLTLSYDKEEVKNFITDIEKEVNQDAVNAKLSMIYSGKFQISNDKSGIKLKSDELTATLTSSLSGQLSKDIIIEAPMEETKAAVTAEQLKSIDTKIVAYATNFAGSAAGRANNIKLATKTVNGTLLMPGEVFSFNGVVGPRTAQKGYMEAGVIIGNKFDSGIGGGICQVSSTLYNAVLRGGLNALERRNHSLPVGYLERGMDATVDYGSIDFKFKNTTDYPIYIEGVINDTNVGFNLYSSSSLTKYRYELTNEVYQPTEPKVTRIMDPTLYEGEEVVETTPRQGFRVKVYRKTIQNNTVIKTETVSDDLYKPVDGVIKYGVKPKPPAPAPAPTPPTPAPTPTPTKPTT